MQSFSHVLGVLRGMLLNLLSGLVVGWSDFPFGLQRNRLVLLILTVWLFSCPDSQAQQSTNVPWAAPGPGALVQHGTGLIPPTPEQLAESRRTHPEIHTVHLNRLGWQRVNDYRQKHHLPLLHEDAIAPKGREIESAIDASFTNTSPLKFSPRTPTPDLNTNSADTTLPDAVDNSTEPWFPPIGDQGG